MFNFSKLGIPVIQAPMAGGVNTPRLASEVSNAGGVGSFGFSYSTPQKISEDLAATRALTNGPINANFLSSVLLIYQRKRFKRKPLKP